MWECNETQDFNDSSDKLGLSEETKDFIRAWARTFNRQITPRSKPYFRSRRNIFEIWAIRIADPESNKGKSGGFRLVCFINLKERSINLCKLDRRDSMGGKNERPKERQKYEAYIQSLKEQLLRELEQE